MAEIGNYAPQDIAITVGGLVIEGYAPDSFISIEQVEDTFSMAQGADGYATRARTSNRNATATITLLASSPSNDVLTAAYNKDVKAGVAVSFQLVDLNGTTLVRAAKAWVRRLPTVEFGSGADNTREWALDLFEADISVGGATSL